MFVNCEATELALDKIQWQALFMVVIIFKYATVKNRSLSCT
jgi:hypothetical protein